MSLSDRRTFVFGALAALSACGFRPAYRDGAAGAALIGQVAFRAPDTPEGFQLRARLEDRLGRTERGSYLLVVELTIRETALAITSDQEINRFNLPGTARWTRYPDGSDVPLASGEVETFTAYSAFGTTVATEEAQRDARERLAIALADRIVTHLTIAAEDGFA